MIGSKLLPLSGRTFPITIDSKGLEPGCHYSEVIVKVFFEYYPVGIYLLKVNNRNTRTWCGKCSKLTIKAAERRQWRLSAVFIVNNEHISHLVLVFLLLALNM